MEQPATLNWTDRLDHLYDGQACRVIRRGYRFSLVNFGGVDCLGVVRPTRYLNVATSEIKKRKVSA